MFSVPVTNILRAATVLAATALAAVGFAAPALAHIELSGSATQGGYSSLTLRVPTESATASTTELRVTLPDDSPMLLASADPKPGWTANIVLKNLPHPEKDGDGNTVTQYVSAVDWKADTAGAAIPPHQFDTFSLSVGPLPMTDLLRLPVMQYYSDGTNVDWDEQSPDGVVNPEHPVPVLTLAPAPPPPPAGGPMWPKGSGPVVAVVALLLVFANFVLLRHKADPR